MKKKALLSSILTIALCISLIAGSTFALFTSTSDVNISVTSGKVDVVATVDQNSIELYSMDVEQQNNFENGGTATFTDTAKLALKNITPGDKATFDIVITNNSTVAVQYKITWSVDGKLAQALVATVDGETLTSNTSDWMKWEAPINEADKTRKVSISIELPITVGNDYQEQSAEISFNVVAVQGNGTSEYVPMCDIVATPSTIDGILATVEEGTIIGLAKGYYDEITLTQDNLSLVSENAVVGFLNLNAKDGAKIDGLIFDQNGAQQTYTFKTGNKQTATGYVANITGDTNSPKSADNVVIKNCTFTNTTAVASAATTDYVPIYFNEQGAATERASNITIQNCVFSCNATQYITLNYLSQGEVVIANNIFGGGIYGTTHNTINASGNAANFTITGNSFNNWNTEKTAIGSSKQGNNTVTWSITKNSFNHVDGAVVLALKTSYTSDNSVVMMENNTALDGNANIVTTPVNAENEDVYAGHKIVVNEGVSAVTSTEDLKSSLTNDATVYLLSGEYSLSSLANYSGVTIIGAEGAVVGGENASTGFASNFGKDTTIKNVTFAGSTNGVRWSYAKGGNSVFENCTFAGDSTYGFHIDSSNGATFTFNNCTFNGFNAFAGDLKSVTFNECTFLHNGNYGHTNIWSTAYFNNCIWGEGTTYGPRGDKAVIYVNGTCNTSSATELANALAAVNGGTVVLQNDISSEAAASAPYGNKYGFKLDGGVLDGNGNKLDIECYGDDYGIMTSGGTVKNLTIEEGCRAVMIMYPTEDIILDNVKIGGDGVLYAINTGESADVEGIELIVTNSVIAGWTSFANIESASFKNVEFKQGTYYNNIYGRVVKPYVNTTFEDCSFIEHMNLDLSELAEGQKVILKNCSVNDQDVTADVFTVPSTDAEYDTELFTVDLPNWASNISDCISFE